MALLVYHLDDSSLAMRTFAAALRQAAPDLELRSFQEFSPLCADLKVALHQGQSVVALFTDLLMPQVAGSEVIRQLKSHLETAGIPILVLTAEQSDGEAQGAKRLGARAILYKPVQVERLREVLQETCAALHLRPTAEDLAGFIDEFADSVEQLREQLQPCVESPHSLDEARYFEIYRQLHTLKGGTAVMGLHPLSADIDLAEEFLQQHRPQGTRLVHSTVTEVLSAFVNHLSVAEKSLRQPEAIPVLPDALRALLTSKAFESTSAYRTALPSEAAPSSEELNPSPGPRKILRIPQEAVDELHLRLKSVIQAKHKISRFHQDLIQEFPEESFPNTLASALQQLDIASQSMLEFFIGLRLVPATRLHATANRVLSETLRTLPKPVTLLWDVPPDLEMDPPILECLEHTVTHWIRNAMDHGIESEELRNSRKKPREGQLVLRIRRAQADQFEVQLQDDGAGIQPERLVKKLVAQGLISQTQAEAMSLKQQLGLIFVDGLSTKEEVSMISGRGVGMGAIKTEVERLGGTIEVESTPARGTDFRLLLPRIFKL